MKRHLVSWATLASLVLTFGMTGAETAAKPAEKATAELKSADEVLARWVKVSGGEEAIRRNKTRVTKGILDIPAMGASLTLLASQKAPNLRVMVMDIPGFGEVKSGYDGLTAWRTAQQGGWEDVTGDQLRQEKEEADYWRLYELGKHFAKLELKPMETLNGRPCYVVEGRPAEGKPEKYFFDRENGLLLRRDAETVTPFGKSDTETLFEDYKEVSGVKVSHVSKRTKPAEMAFTFKVTELKFNTELDDAIFKKPTKP